MLQTTQRTQALRNAALLFLATTLTACCRSFSDEETRRDRAARQWIHPYPGQYRWDEMHEWKTVDNSRLSLAEGLVRGATYVHLTEKQAGDLLGQAARPKIEAKAPYRSTEPYLMRGVGDGRERFPLELSVDSKGNGDVWVGGGANSTCAVPMERRAVVAWLEKPPSNVYVTFVVGR
jgi:hypothetical protein